MSNLWKKFGNIIFPIDSGSRVDLRKANIGDHKNYVEINDKGQLILHNKARVTRHLSLGACNLKSGSSSPTSGFTGIFPHLAFSHVTSQECHSKLIVPYRLDLSEDIEVCLDWLYTGGQDNGTVKWGLEYNSRAEGEDPAVGSVTISNVSAGSHLTGKLIRTCLTVKILGSNLTPEDSFGMRIFRDRANDTLATSAKLLGVHLHMIQDKLGELS